MMRLLTAAVLAVGLALAGSAGSAGAWGEIGHKIVCEIAFRELNLKARQEVSRLIALDTQYDTFSDSCIWPDNPRQRKPEHFINVKRSTAVFEGEHCPVASTCLFTAIRTELAVLGKKPGNDAAKLRSLKFLGHWIGDLHQPLHISFQDDLGGNSILGTGECFDDLHAVWDSCIIRLKLGGHPRDVGKTLQQSITPTDRAAWRGGTILQWANESLEITRRASVEYCVPVGGSCWYAAGNERYSSGEAQKVVAITPAYVEAHAPTVTERLKQAGVRLGYVLNQVLGQ